MRYRNRRMNRTQQRAAVAVEFAVVCPVLLSVVMGMIEVTRAYDAQNLMQTAAREGARFASMDRTDMLQEGETTNSKLIEDVTDFLAASGLPADAFEVKVLNANDPTQTFNLDDPDNDLELFVVEISMMFSEVSYMPMTEAYDYALTASIVFRNGQATLSE